MTETIADVYDRVAQRYEERFLDELVGKPRDRQLLDTIGGADPVVEIGCGPGQVGAYLRRQGRYVAGLDVSRNMASLAATRLDASLVGDMRSLPIASGTVGAILAFYSVIHLARNELSGAFHEFARVLTPEGRVLVAAQEGPREVMVREFLGEPVTLGANFYAVDELASAATAAGLSVITAERRDPYPSEGQSVRLYLLARRRMVAP